MEGVLRLALVIRVSNMREGFGESMLPWENVNEMPWRQINLQMKLESCLMKIQENLALIPLFTNRWSWVPL